MHTTPSATPSARSSIIMIAVNILMMLVAFTAMVNTYGLLGALLIYGAFIYLRVRHHQDTLRRAQPPNTQNFET